MTVLGALAVMGGLTLGGLLLGVLEHRMGLQRLHAVQAEEAAEAGVVLGAALPAGVFAALPLGARTSLLPPTTITPGIDWIRYTVQAERLSRSFVRLGVTGERLSPEGRILAVGRRGAVLELVAMGDTFVVHPIPRRGGWPSDW